MLLQLYRGRVLGATNCVKYVTVAASADKFVFLWRLVAACLTLERERK